MFSKKIVLVVGAIVLIVANIIILSVNSNRRYPARGIGGIALMVISPFQEMVTQSIHFARDVWKHYFYLVSTSMENEDLRKQLSIATENNNLCFETRLSNERFRNLLAFKKELPYQLLGAEVVGKDPSPWFKTIMINKGAADGVRKGMPVVIPEGIVGLVIDVSGTYSKTLLIVDRNSSVDALIQKTRARGIVKGDPTGRCVFKYVLRKHDINIGDTVISSGLDGVFPKGLRVGRISEIVKLNSGIFQEVAVTPYVDFETLEEVFIVSLPTLNDLSNETIIVP